MKKIVSFLLAIFMLLSLSGCYYTEIVMSVEATGDASFMYADSGSLYFWGDNSAFTQETVSVTAQPVRFGTVEKVIDMSFGENWSLWLTLNGVIVAGDTAYLPFESDSERVPPTLLCTLNSEGMDSGVDNYVLVGKSVVSATEIAAGKDFSLVLLEDGSVWGWGNAESNALGSQYTGIVKEVVQLNLPEGISRISSSWGGTSSAIASDGSVICWGGYLTESFTVTLPAPATQVVCGYGGWLALTQDNNTYTWNNERTEPKLVDGPSDCVAVVAKLDGFSILTRAGDVWSFDITRPGFWKVPGIENVVALSAGTDHYIAIRKDGTVWTWGEGGKGQLGNGKTESSNSPVQISEQTRKVDIRK